jgi:hypothetical protein
MNELADDLSRSLLGSSILNARGSGGFIGESSGGKYRSLDATTLVRNNRIHSIKDSQHENPQKAQTGRVLSFKLEQSILVGVHLGIRPAQKETRA